MTTTLVRPGRTNPGTHMDIAGPDSNIPADHSGSDAQRSVVGGEQNREGSEATENVPSPMAEPSLADPFLQLSADIVDDAERNRIANENRLRQLTRTETDADGEERGFGLDESHPDVARLAALVDMLREVEHQAVLQLNRQMRAHPLGPWCKAQVGLGEKQTARLLASIGDPYWNTLHDRPRTVSELWAYCGLHVLPAGQFAIGAHLSSASGDQTSDPGQVGHDTPTVFAGVAAKRRKGQRANWSPDAKTRAYLIACSCIKHVRSPYRATYDQRRTHTATTHPEWTPGHSHNDALRIASKAILRDLWRESKRIHEETP